MNETEEEGFKCACGKEYKYASGLCRHKAVCADILKPTTQKALDNTISINKPDNLDIDKVNWRSIEQMCKECQTESDDFQVRLQGITFKWGKFRSVCEHIIKQVFFNTPNNMVFYIPNLSTETAFMYNGDSFDEVSIKDMIEHILDAVDGVVDKMIEKFKLVEDHPFVFIHNYQNYSRPREASTVSFNFMHKNIKAYIMEQYKENKDDIRAVWRKAELL
jgi:hypothetical protein